jgi:hypothetical protein
MTSEAPALPAAVHDALGQEYAERLLGCMARIPSGVAQVAIFCPERECVVVGLSRGPTLESWLIAPAVDVEDAVAIADKLRPVFANVADDLGHFDAQDAIDKARAH